ncbi:MAG: type II secretion system protein GspG [Myxococcales bacterium]|nr:type II secretion system protein GspG [Myxococcales bacterium]
MSRRRKSTVALPWERRGSWRQLLGGSRWKVALALGALAGLALALAGYAERRAKVRETRGVVAEVQRAAFRFRTQIGRCPSSLDELAHPPRSGARFLRRVPEDAWGRRLFFRCPGRFDADDIDVLSAGPSGNLFVDDNVF